MSRSISIRRRPRAATRAARNEGRGLPRHDRPPGQRQRRHAVVVRRRRRRGTTTCASRRRGVPAPVTAIALRPGRIPTKSGSARRSASGTARARCTMRQPPTWVWDLAGQRAARGGGRGPRDLQRRRLRLLRAGNRGARRVGAAPRRHRRRPTSPTCVRTTTTCDIARALSRSSAISSRDALVAREPRRASAAGAGVDPRADVRFPGLTARPPSTPEPLRRFQAALRSQHQRSARRVRPAHGILLQRSAARPRRAAVVANAGEASTSRSGRSA